MKVAVIGGGVTGMALASGLQSTMDVTLYESQARLGGHTDTHNLFVDGRSYAIDSGFMAFNANSFPRFSNWLEQLGIATKETNMSFAVSINSEDLAYGTGDIGALFSNRKSLLNQRFLHMLWDISRFFKEARKLNAIGPNTTAAKTPITLGDYLDSARFSAGFIEDHLLPLCLALWSTNPEQARNLPLGYVLGFLERHNLLHVDRRATWRVVEGGSNRYVSAFLNAYQGETLLSTTVTRVERNPGFVRVFTASDERRFDRVVFACHADQALQLIEPTATEREILGAFQYQTQKAVVHSDPSFMPARTKAWSSWNVVGDNRAELSITYWLNQLQSLENAPNFFVTLNPARSPRSVWMERVYTVPVFSLATQAAQQRREEISGHNRTYYAGAYWGFSTHEDGFVSGEQVAQALTALPNVAVSA